MYYTSTEKNSKEKMQNAINEMALDSVKGIAEDLLKSLSEEGLAQSEELCRNLGNSLSQGVLALTLNAYDDEIHRNISRIDYKVISKELRVIKTIFGSVSFYRRRYKSLRKDAKSSYFYPLDEKIGLVQKARVSPLLAQVVASTAARQSYASSSKTIEEITGSHISSMSARDCVIKTAEIIDAENAKNTASFWDDAEVIGKVEAPTLCVESDAVYIAEQQRGSERRRKKLKVNMAKAYTGKTKVGKSILVNDAIVFGKVQSIGEFRKDATAAIYSKFNIASVKECYHSTDGEPGYKNMTTIIHPEAQHILDPYHIHNKITEKCSDKVFGNNIRKLIFDYNNVSEACLEIDEMRKSVNICKRERKKLTELYDYLFNNIHSIDNQHPKLGTMESTNGHVIGSRLKVFGGGWGVAGANAMITIRTSLASGNELPVMRRRA